MKKMRTTKKLTTMAMLERSYVLIEIFGLSCKQVAEVERNKGFMDADFN